MCIAKFVKFIRFSACLVLFLVPYRSAKRDEKTKYHTKDSLLKAKVVDGKQHEAIPDATRDLKRKFKYVSMDDLMRTTLLTDFMEKIGKKKPQWDITDIGGSLRAVLIQQSTVMAFSKFIIHQVTANRQEMTKGVKNELTCKLACSLCV